MQLDKAPTALPDSVQAESVAEKFVPDTSTVAPAEAEDGLSESDGTGIKEAVVDEVEFVLAWSIDMEFCCAALAPKLPTKDSTPTNSRTRMHNRCERCIQDSHISDHIRLNLLCLNVTQSI
jgi:hypothetical protein